MKYSFNSPYAFSENRVIDARELEGLESALTNKLEFGLNTAQKCQDFNDICKENKYVILGSCGIALVGVAVSIYGVATVGTYILKEGGEMIFEELTGIPVILDPLDLLEGMMKKGGLVSAKEMIVEGRKFAAGSSTQMLKDWAWNVQTYGQNIAKKLESGIVSFYQANLLKKNGFGDLVSNFDVRKWYDTKVKAININIPPTEANARKIVTERNRLKREARDMMADREEAKRLDIKHPLREFEHYEKKYYEEGMTKEELYREIMEGGTRPNKDVNKANGIE
jgi:hypothetical protein